MKTTCFGFSTALQTFIQRYFSMQMLSLHCDLYEWRRVRSAHTKLLLDISGDLRRCVGSQISAIASIFPIELTRSTLGTTVVSYLHVLRDVCSSKTPTAMTRHKAVIH